MATIKRFEDLESWKGARALVQEIYTVSSNGRFSRDLILRDQIRRAAISMMANIAEGFNRSKAKYLNCLDIALGEANEAENWLYKLRDSKLLTRETANSRVAETIEIQKMLSALYRSISRTST